MQESLGFNNVPYYPATYFLKISDLYVIYTVCTPVYNIKVKTNDPFLRINSLNVNIQCLVAIPDLSSGYLNKKTTHF